MFVNISMCSGIIDLCCLCCCLFPWYSCVFPKITLGICGGFSCLYSNDLLLTATVLTLLDDS